MLFNSIFKNTHTHKTKTGAHGHKTCRGTRDFFYHFFLINQVLSGKCQISTEFEYMLMFLSL